VRGQPLGRPSAALARSAQARLRAIGEIVNALIQRVTSGEDVDLNAIKKAAALKYSLPRSPKLVEIIAALPNEHKASLLPQ
jgi:elongator complex protein 3